MYFLLLFILLCRLKFFKVVIEINCYLKKYSFEILCFGLFVLNIVLVGILGKIKVKFIGYKEIFFFVK